MDGVKHFSDFFKNKKDLPKFNKQEILDEFFIEDSQIQTDQIEEVESIDYTKQENPIENLNETTKIDKEEIDRLIAEEVEKIRKQTIEEWKANERAEIVLPIEESTESEESENSETDEDEVEDTDEVEYSVPVYNQDYYKVWADKSETFSCDIELEGANLKDTQVRLVLESDNWNLMFPGEITASGKVTIPIRKLNIFEEGTKGKIKMEVIAEGTVFTPWEDDFEVKLSKKVLVKFNESNSTNPKKIFKKPEVKVNFKKR